MCRTLVEIQYLVCGHLDTWEIPSPLAQCTGIIHRLTWDSLTTCKHCWVLKTGYQKKKWITVRKSLLKRDPYIFLYHVRTQKRPIQSVNAVRTADCPTWKRRYPWQNRSQILREIKLRRMDIQNELELVSEHYNITRNPRESRDLAPFHNTDEGVVDSGLLRVVEPENAFPLNGRCNFCFGNFIDEDPAQRFAGGEGMLRSLDCRFRHSFCLGCILQHFLIIRTQREEQAYLRIGDRPPPYDCPYCHDEFNIFWHKSTNMKLRLANIFEYNSNSVLQGLGHGDPNYPVVLKRDLKIREWIAYSAGWIFILPMLFAIEHSMGTFQSRSGPAGRLPFPQIVIVGLTGLVFQLFWIPFIVFAPIIYTISQLQIAKAFAAWLTYVLLCIPEYSPGYLIYQLSGSLRDFFCAIFAGLWFQYHYQAGF